MLMLVLLLVLVLVLVVLLLLLLLLLLLQMACPRSTLRANRCSTSLKWAVDLFGTWRTTAPGVAVAAHSKVPPSNLGLATPCTRLPAPHSYCGKCLSLLLYTHPWV
jgi:hypothetical protein